jgi:hypothetical protein
MLWRRTVHASFPLPSRRVASHNVTSRHITSHRVASPHTVEGVGHPLSGEKSPGRAGRPGPAPNTARRAKGLGRRTLCELPYRRAESHLRLSPLTKKHPLSGEENPPQARKGDAREGKARKGKARPANMPMEEKGGIITIVPSFSHLEACAKIMTAAAAEDAASFAESD